MRKDGWSDEDIALLRKLVDEGLTGSQIARRLGGTRSRNAIIGKTNRMGLHLQNYPEDGARMRMADDYERPKRKHSPGFRRSPRKPVEAAPVATAVSLPTAVGVEQSEARDIKAPQPVPRLHLPPSSMADAVLALTPGQCRWPHGDRDQFYFCGELHLDGMPYCEQHTARAARRW